MRKFLAALDGSLTNRLFQPVADLLDRSQNVRLTAAALLIFATFLRGYQLSLEQSSGAGLADLILTGLPILMIPSIGWTGFAYREDNESPPFLRTNPHWVNLRSFLTFAVLVIVSFVVWRATKGSIPAQFVVSAVFWPFFWAGTYLLACQQKLRAQSAS